MLFEGASIPKSGRLIPDASAPGMGLALKRADAEKFRVFDAVVSHPRSRS